VHSKEAIKAVYSPSHDIDIERRGDHNVTVGYEDYDVLPDTDFELIYTVAQEDIGLNLLSYAQEGEDGFFLMLLAPRVEVETTEVVAKDVILVLDTSGSMRGEKLRQAKVALSFVLDHLHDGDRFNVIAFSTGVRSFGNELHDIAERSSAYRWVNELEAKGGTNINRAMLEALAQAEQTRPTIMIFLTDGLATEGVVETDRILHNIDDAAPDNVRIFAFGVGDDVNTILLDKMAREHRGASTYVRPGQRIDEEVSAFYAKVSTPLLSDISIDFAHIQVEDTYPYPLPDLFAGTQIVMVGQYRGDGEATITVRGTVNDQERTFEFGSVRFEEDGGDTFIPRLWATRKVGYLLNQIRLHGESPELVEEIVDLSVRYGIMTPYTAFLVNEDNDVFSETGRQRTAEREYSVMATATPAAPSGRAAVDEAQEKMDLERSGTATGATGSVVKIVRDKTFLYREGMWIDTSFDADRMTPLKVGFISDDYFALITARPEWGVYLAIGDRMLVVLDGKAYRIVGQDDGETIDIPTPQNTENVEQVTPTIQATSLAQETPSTRATRAIQPTVVASPTQERSTICGGAVVAVLLTLLAVSLFARPK
jgi:Ca-activated chloride channel family protein